MAYRAGGIALVAVGAIVVHAEGGAAVAIHLRIDDASLGIEDAQRV